MPSNPPASHIHVALIDDHPAIRSGIREAVADTIDVSVVAEADSAEEAIQRIEEKQPDVAVLDLSIDNGDGFQVLEVLQTQCPETQAVIFSMYAEKAYAPRALQAGASGYVMKDASVDELITAIRRVAEGGTYLSTQMVSRVLKNVVDGPADSVQFPVDELTDRERQVFQMLGQGLSLDEIAERLDLARTTIETYRRRAKQKLGFDKVSELMTHAIQWTDAQSESEN